MYILIPLLITGDLEEMKKILANTLCKFLNLVTQGNYPSFTKLLEVLNLKEPWIFAIRRAQAIIEKEVIQNDPDIYDFLQRRID